MSKSIQKALLSEIFSAQERGFLESCSAIISENDPQAFKNDKVGISYYDTKASVYSEDGASTKREYATVDDYPDFAALYVKFNRNVDEDKIERISEYIKKKYRCKTFINGFRLDVYGIPQK